MMPEDPVHYFCESMNVGSNDENFAMILKSGGTTTVFIFSPDHMKQVARLITMRVDEWEKAHNQVLPGILPNEPRKSPYNFSSEDGKV